MVSRPSLKGAACAIAGAGNLKVAAAAPAAVPAMNLRRVNLRPCYIFTHKKLFRTRSGKHGNERI
jgi:hypothetical protein